MNEIDLEIERRINEMAETARFIHNEMTKRFGPKYSMSDIMKNSPTMNEQVPSELCFPLDYKYTKK